MPEEDSENALDRATRDSVDIIFEPYFVLRQRIRTVLDSLSMN